MARSGQRAGAGLSKIIVLGILEHLLVCKGDLAAIDTRIKVLQVAEACEKKKRGKDRNEEGEGSKENDVADEEDDEEDGEEDEEVDKAYSLAELKMRMDPERYEQLEANINAGSRNNSSSGGSSSGGSSSGGSRRGKDKKRKRGNSSSNGGSNGGSGGRSVTSSQWPFTLQSKNGARDIPDRLAVSSLCGSNQNAALAHAKQKVLCARNCLLL
jgi:hypothetical protein